MCLRSSRQLDLCYFYIRCNISQIFHTTQASTIQGEIKIHRRKLTKRGESWEKKKKNMLVKSITERCGDVTGYCEEHQTQFLVDNSSDQKMPQNWKHLLKRPSFGMQSLFYDAGLKCTEGF